MTFNFDIQFQLYPIAYQNNKGMRSPRFYPWTSLYAKANVKLAEFRDAHLNIDKYLYDFLYMEW